MYASMLGCETSPPRLEIARRRDSRNLSFAFHLMSIFSSAPCTYLLVYLFYIIGNMMLIFVLWQQERGQDKKQVGRNPDMLDTD